MYKLLYRSRCLVYCCCFPVTLARIKARLNANTSLPKEGEVELVVLDPGHLRQPLAKIPTEAGERYGSLLAPQGDELDQYMKSIEDYNQRAENPTHWHVELYRGEDYLEK